MPTYSCRFGGPLASGEIFNTGFHVSSVDDIETVAGALTTWASDVWNGGGFAGIANLNPTTTNMSSLVVYQLNPTTGRSVDKSERTMFHVGTGTGLPMPNGVALCVTLLTLTTTRAGKGRMYFPAPDATHLTAAARVPTPVTTTYAQAIGNAFNNLGLRGINPIIYSVGRADRPVTGINVGDVYDSQRRRRDQLVETRTPAVPVTTGLALPRAAISF